MKRFATISYKVLENIKANKLVQKRLIFTSSVQTRPCLQLDWEGNKESVLHHLSHRQQKRGYAPKTLTNYKNCWNCKKVHANEDIPMLCQHCGLLHDVKTDINFFHLFNFPQNFDLDAQVLTKRFRQLQKVVHPDKFSNKSYREQSNSADWSSLINKAYKTLLVPLERGQYLLELNGLNMPQDNSALDKEFLMEMMERNEEVEDASTEKKLNIINDRLAQELIEKVESLVKSFSQDNFEKAKTLLIEMKYLISIQKTIKNKLQTLLRT